MKICVVMGAGASLANALHFRPQRQRDSRPPLDTTFFKTVEARGISLSQHLRAYFPSFLGFRASASKLQEQRMEQIFADVFYDLQELPDDPVPLNAYIDLVDLYLRVLRETTNWICEDNRTGAPVGRLLAAAGERATRLDVVTFNHDLVIENEIFRRTRLRRRWCLDLGYGSISQDLKPLYPASTGARPSFPLHEANACEHDEPIRLLKLHGSLNWLVRINSSRPTSTFLRTGASGAIRLLPIRRVQGREVFVRPRGRGRTEWKLWPVVVPPVYGKQAVRGAALQATWADARASLAEADRVVVFGYSLPQLDVDAEKLFERSLSQNTAMNRFDVVNPAPESAARFAGIAPERPLRWYPSVDAFLDDGAFA